MKIKINLSIVLLILLSSCTPLTSPGKTIVNASEEIQQGQNLPITATADIAGEIFQLEVALTPEQQATGLMFRESLADNRGMLFPFESERQASFWMKNVPIALDMIFLNGDRIVEIADKVPPCTSDPCPVYGPQALVDRVLELRGGRAQELGLSVNDRISIQPLNSSEKLN
ncbi:MAG: DUF192 domain-containing protein [Pleurocapsa sp. MO_226.B13]|nr:DUF192 domain-containing protein [Pleurocapsa sp. MO_226.B13]